MFNFFKKDSKKKRLTQEDIEESWKKLRKNTWHVEYLSKRYIVDDLRLMYQNNKIQDSDCKVCERCGKKAVISISGQYTQYFGNSIDSILYLNSLCVFCGRVEGTY